MQRLKNICFEIYTGLMTNILIPLTACYGSYLGALLGGKLKSFPEITLETSPQRIEQLAYFASWRMADQCGLSTNDEFILNGQGVNLIAINYYLAGLKMRNHIKQFFLRTS